MTPKHYVHQIRRHVRARKLQEALDFAQRHGPEMTPRLSIEQLDLVSGMMKTVDLTLTLERLEAEQTTGGVPGKSHRRAS